MRCKFPSALALTMIWGAMALPVAAQGRGGGMRGGADLDAQMAELSAQLDLTEEQAVEVRKVLETQGERRRARMEAMRGGGDRSAMRTAMREVQEETNQLLSEILDEAQMEKYRELQAQRRKRRRPPPY